MFEIFPTHPRFHSPIGSFNTIHTLRANGFHLYVPRCGAAFTRFQTRLLQNRYDELDGNVISYGPCQFPTLGFVVERQRKIDMFRPQNYWGMSLKIEVPRTLA